MALPKMRLTIIGLIIFALVYWISAYWFPKPEKIAVIPTQELELLTAFALQLAPLLESPDPLQTQEIQKLLENEKSGDTPLRQFHWQVKFSKIGTAPTPGAKSFFEGINDSTVTLTIPLGVNRVKGWLVATKSLPHVPF